MQKLWQLTWTNSWQNELKLVIFPDALLNCTNFQYLAEEQFCIHE